MNNINRNLALAEFDSENPAYKHVLAYIARHYKITPEMIQSMSRVYSTPRFVVACIIKWKYKLSNMKIGVFLGGRQNASIINAFRQVERWYETDAKFRREMHLFASYFNITIDFDTLKPKTYGEVSAN